MRGLVWGGLTAGLVVASVWGAGQGLALLAGRGLADLAQAGRGGFESVTASGFPERIGVTVTGLRLADPLAGLEWQAPQAQITAPVWAPLRWSADLALPQRVTFAGQRFRLAGESTALALRPGLGADLPLDRADLMLVAPSLTHEAAARPSLAAQSVEISLQSGEDPGQYRLEAAVRALALPPRLAARLTPQAALSDRIEHLTLQAGLRFDTPLAAFAKAPPRLTLLDLTGAELLWDGHRIAAAGPLRFAADGSPEGTILISLTDWPVWLDLALAAGLLPPERKAMLTAVGRYLAGQSTDGSVQVPLSFARGRMTLAAVPLGAAPKL